MKHTAVGDEIGERASLYALGALSRQEACAFEEHLAEGCAACEDELRSFEEITGALALAAPAAAPPAGVREKLAQQLAQNGSAQKSRKTFAAAGAEQFLTVREDEGTWEKMFEGIFVKRLFVDKRRSTVTSLYKFAPGAQIPPHPHGGVEECYILEGDLEANGEVFGPGDYTCAPAGSFHPVVRTQGGAMVLIIEQASREIMAHF
ncbi:MAG TPA: cupin domain-containing protein [Pyrinomonadaceae bacterium]|nr:cupin domain-containing protein [Pyrinomonadaceae bacterium]